MARNIKCRKVCMEYNGRVFIPLKEEQKQPPVILSVEELESLRLCDLETLSQEQASKCMEVSRGTFQRILYSARKKTAQALCEGKRLIICGGNYELAANACKEETRCKRCIRKINLEEENDE